jgi:predicted MFS family arabinose efflux permease
MSERRLSSGLLVVMSVATGAIVANLYYLQPLLHEVSLSFKVSTTAATGLITMSQVGYALGLALVLPLGDLLARRWLIPGIYLGAALLMALGSVFPTFLGFAIVTLFIGTASVGGQVMIPLAADLAEASQRGRVVARLMSGLLMGVLLSRTVSGYVSELAGWRAVYVLGASLMALFGLLMGVLLPEEAQRPKVRYARLVTDSIRLLATLPELRRRAWLGAMGFACFSVLWSTLAFELSGAPYHYSNGTIGAFGLLGVAGVLAANAAGSLADADRTREMTIASGSLLVLSFAILALGGWSILGIVIGIVAADSACQGMQITNQAIIYRLAPHARSRINSAYMVCYFLGGALGSIAGGLAWSLGRWSAVCELGAGFGLAALIPSLWWLRKSAVSGPTELQRRRADVVEGTA